LRSKGIFSRTIWMVRLCLAATLFAGAQQANAAETPDDIPLWLQAHVGANDGQIAELVLQRARSLYLQKVRDGKVKNPCYFAMDATRPNDKTEGKNGGRFYIVCEATQSFRVISSGHGSGRNLTGVADFSNSRQCAKNFGNALDSDLTAGGAYITDETKTSFKGYYRISAGKDSVLLRTFVQFEGEGETADARKRVIGGHAAAVVKGICRQKKPSSPYADHDGYVPLGTLVDYSAGRSNGCTSWSPSDAAQIIPMLKNNPTTLYIYPEARDISAVAKAVSSGQSLSHSNLYWNAACLSQIGAPKFWSRATLEPVIAQYRKDHPAPPRRPIPLCTAQ
jgi:hypothetical protein